MKPPLLHRRKASGLSTVYHDVGVSQVVASLLNPRSLKRRHGEHLTVAYAMETAIGFTMRWHNLFFQNFGDSRKHCKVAAAHVADYWACPGLDHQVFIDLHMRRKGCGESLCTDMSSTNCTVAFWRRACAKVQSNNHKVSRQK